MSNGISEMTALSTPGEVGRDQRGLAAVAPEQLDHGDPLVGAGARAEVVDELHAARDRGREADAVIGAVDVVVHRLRDRDHGHALVVHPQPVRERVVAADRDQHVDPDRLDHAQGVVGEVERPFAVDAVREVRRHVLRPDAARVRARGVEERAAGAVDRAHRVLLERQEVPRLRGGVVRIVLEQRRPAAAEPDHLVPLVRDAVDDGLDARVEARHVAASGQDSDPHSRPLVSAVGPKSRVTLLRHTAAARRPMYSFDADTNSGAAEVRRFRAESTQLHSADAIRRRGRPRRGAARGCLGARRRRVAGRRRHDRAALRAAGRLAAARQQDQGARLLPELVARSARAADRQPLEQHRLGRQGSQLPRELGLAGGRRPQHAGDPRDPARLSRPDGDPANLPGRDHGEREDLPQEDRRASRTREAPGARRAGSRRRCTPSTTAPTPGMSSSPGAAEARSTPSASTWRRRSRSRRSSPT